MDLDQCDSTKWEDTMWGKKINIIHPFSENLAVLQLKMVDLAWVLSVKHFSLCQDVCSRIVPQLYGVGGDFQNFTFHVFVNQCVEWDWSTFSSAVMPVSASLMCISGGTLLWVADFHQHVLSTYPWLQVLQHRWQLRRPKVWIQPWGQKKCTKHATVLKVFTVTWLEACFIHYFCAQLVI